jgi:hypothetical protein
LKRGKKKLKKEIRERVLHFSNHRNLKHFKKRSPEPSSESAGVLSIQPFYFDLMINIFFKMVCVWFCVKNYFLKFLNFLNHFILLVLKIKNILKKILLSKFNWDCELMIFSFFLKKEGNWGSKIWMEKDKISFRETWDQIFTFQIETPASKQL